jgi:hypothetical protein
MNPFNEFQPEERQLVAGLTGGWNFTYGEIRAVPREVDRDTRNFVSERAAVEARSHRSMAQAGSGTECDIARDSGAEADIM